MVPSFSSSIFSTPPPSGPSPLAIGFVAAFAAIVIKIFVHSESGDDVVGWDQVSMILKKDGLEGPTGLDGGFDEGN